MRKVSVPAEIIHAINTMLAPYGQKYHPADERTVPRLTVTIAEAAAMLGVGYNTVWRLCQTGRLRMIKVGNGGKQTNHTRALIPLHAIHQLLCIDEG